MQLNLKTKPWWLDTENNSEVENATESKGLTSIEAKVRLAKYGPNTLNEIKAKSLFFQYLQRFKILW